MTDTEAAAIVAGVQKAFSAGWNAGDGQACADQCTTDADFVNLIGMYVSGRPAIAQLHQRIFDTIYRGSTSTFQTTRARFLSDDVILAQMNGEVEVPAGPRQGSITGVITMVLGREDGAWRIAGFQNTRKELPPSA